MAAKNTFTAGSSIVASTMNENFANLPYSMEIGQPTSITGTANFTYTASRFTTAPVVFVTVNSTTGTAGSATVTSVTSSGFTVNVWNGATLATVARTVYWQAIQQKSNQNYG